MIDSTELLAMMNRVWENRLRMHRIKETEEMRDAVRHVEQIALMEYGTLEILLKRALGALSKADPPAAAAIIEDIERASALSRKETPS